MLTAWEADEALIKLLGQYSQNSPHVLREGQGGACTWIPRSEPGLRGRCLREETEQDRRWRLAYGTEDWHWVRWVAYPALTVPHSYGREALQVPQTIAEPVPWRCSFCNTVSTRSLVSMVLGGGPDEEPDVLNCGPCGFVGAQSRKARYELEHTGPAKILAEVEKFLIRVLAGIVLEYTGPPTDPLLRALQAKVRRLVDSGCGSIAEV